MAHLVKLPSKIYLQECFEYNQRTGELRWRTRPLHHFSSAKNQAIFNVRWAGKLAGLVSARGYRYIRLGRQGYLAHRLIWKMMTGKDPRFTVDHKDTNKLNNRWVNLRSATRQEQKWNMTRPTNNTSGYKGVSWKRKNKSWCATINIDGIRQYIGLFATAKKASLAYQVAARKLHGEFYRA